MDPATIGSLTGILVPLGAFALAAVLVGMDQLAKHRARELRHQTIRIALDKGQPVPPELLREQDKVRGPRNDLGQGIVILSTGIGLAAFLFLIQIRQWPVGLILVAVGIGRIVAHYVAPTRQAAPPAP
ncbi:MAG: hypothetical protein HZB56_16550 [Deltaproteobacteria bacterium]|nr:hypothetical protein [Deltaproteobacteria bacterium]